MKIQQNFILIGLMACVLLMCIKTVHSEKESSDSTFDLPCKPFRVEISFPKVSDADGRVTSQVFQESQPRTLLHVKMKWRRRPVEVILYKNDLTRGPGIVEWEDGNVTFANTIGMSCFYHGYIKGQPTSYVALSTCGGLRGYLQTDKEMLFIEPRTSGTGSSQAHLVYTCESASRDQGHSEQNSYARTMGRRRRRRAAGHAKYLEVQVVIDHTMVKAIGSKEKTEAYVMTLMNIANTVFQHKSLGVNIKVIVVKIVFLDKNKQRYVFRRRDPLGTVNRFCQWSVDNIPKGKPVDYDISVFITKDELGPSGYAPITGMCNPIRSCAAVHDEGFTTGFVIAHEAAHVFGLFHDGHGNNCYGNNYNSAIMAPVVEAKLNHFWWSECSKRRMKDVIRFLSCINDKSTEVKDHYSLDAPQRILSKLGKPWSLDFQCKMEFGDYFELCHAFNNDHCGVLWCSKRNNRQHCRTKRGPPMPGSVCGRDKECHNNRCQYVGNRRPVDGKWSHWSSWTECSNDCGVGVRQRSRACNNPGPMFNGKDCTGDLHKWDTCHNTTCTNFQDIREGECAVWDSMQIRRGTHKWLPFEPVNASTQCKQTCKSFYTGTVVTIGVDVADGSPCSYVEDTSDVCMAGRCMKVGCDGKMNSAKKWDACGVCGGDGSECKFVEGTYKLKPKSGNKYLKVLTLPSGARNISINGLQRTFKFLALEDSKFGKYLLNGKKKQSRGGQMVLKGTLWDYTQSSSNQNESLKTPGPLKTMLDVMVLPDMRLQDIAISYSYTVHKSDFTLEKNKYSWKFAKWSACSVTCNTGFQTIVYGCFDKDMRQMVETEKCAYLAEPRKDQVKCTRTKCGRKRYNFAMLDEFSECDAKCGQQGVQTQLFRCEQVEANNIYKTVDMKFCDHLPEPGINRKCKGESCQNEEAITYEWTTAKEWSECKSGKKCGGTGYQSRQVRCIAVRGERKTSNETVEDKECDAKTKPKTSKSCQAAPCPDKFRWTVKGKWSECPCGKLQRHQNRSVVCERVREDHRGKTSVSLANSKDCQNVTQKPESERTCKGVPCPPSYQWKTSGGFGLCNAECGESGRQTAKIVCQKVVEWNNRNTINVVPDSFCKSKPKAIDRPCQGPPCKPVYKWKQTSNWTECNAKCDETATQYNILMCEKSIKDQNHIQVADRLCTGLPKLKVTKECKGPFCPLKWQIGEWSECSVSCGRGKRKRTVYCGDPKTDMDDLRCTDDPPPISKRCDLTWCPVPKGDECRDMFSFCTTYMSLHIKCKRPSFKKRCCKTCQKYIQGDKFIEPPKNALERYMKKRGLGRWKSKVKH